MSSACHGATSLTSCVGYTPLGSLKPSLVSGLSSGIPPKVPMITGSCAFLPSRKKPNTQVPSTGPVGDVPIPFILALVIGCDGVAQGKVFVGISCLLSV